jgi:transcriptional regulator with XRE-family HTH domain
MDIGKIIKKLRLAQGLTQEQLALEIDSDGANVSRIERGTQQATLKGLELLAHALKTTPALIVSEACDADAQAAPAELDDIKQLLRNYRTLNAENQRLALELVRLLSRLQSPLS